MREKFIAEENQTLGIVAKAPWRLTQVMPQPGYRLSVRFMDGTAGEADLSRLVTSPGAGVFVALREPGAFERVFLLHGAATWPGDIDLAPDAMYDSIKATGRWMPE